MVRPRIPTPLWAPCIPIPLRSTRCALFFRQASTLPHNIPSSLPAQDPAQLPEYMLEPAKITKETAVLRRYKPRTPGLRHLRRTINGHLWKGRPFMPLTYPKKGHGKGGRNVFGKITVRHRGGGAKRRIRTLDFMRSTPGPRTVERIEYDPNRSAHIALVSDQRTGKKSYITAPDGLRAGDTVQSYRGGIPRDLLRYLSVAP